VALAADSLTQVVTAMVGLERSATMKLIRRIEISYLRSLYTAVLDRPGDMNVVFGRNDSGKSNLLRALNLFFNEETEPGRGEIEFDLDFSDIRRDAAKAAPGRPPGAPGCKRRCTARAQACKRALLE
jgi:ABC-type histidine transport system ATPase subunit